MSVADLSQAVALLRQGGLVAIPTETVYGLAADAEQEAAVRRIFAAKGRPADHPVIVHLGRREQLADWAADVPPAAWLLAEAFWPGPLTMILRRSPRARDVVTGGLETVGLRLPSHPLARELLLAFGGALAAPSANRFGRVSPTTAEHVRQELGDRVDLVLDGGPCAVGLESTIVDLTGSAPTLLRPGGVTMEQLSEALGQPVLPAGAEGPRCSGRLASHYAPQAVVELVPPGQLRSRAEALLREGRRVAVLSSHPEDAPPGALALPIAPEASAAARQLYAWLRQADEAGCEVIVASLPPSAGLGAALADRLSKASGPRDA